MQKIAKIGLFSVTALTLATSVYVAGTYAKYTEEVSGSSTVTVAKFDYTLTGGGTALTSEGATLNLFGTINDTGDTTDETDVADTKIAPGTAGHFDVVFTNTSEVTVNYTLALNETNAASVPIQYCATECTTEANWKAADQFTFTASNVATGAAASTTSIKWRWLYESGTDATLTANDTADTTIGKLAAAPTVTVTVNATVTQVD